MKFAIVSDSHNNQLSIKKVLDYLNKNNIKTLIHCGDIDTPDDITLFGETFNGGVHLVYGNSDYGKQEMENLVKKFKNIISYGDIGKIEIDKIKITWNHFPEIAKELAQTGKYDLVFHGHTHKPWEEKYNNTTVLNPGNVAGQYYKATFAIYDTGTKKAKLIIIETI